ncbi:hypothetical protein F0562_026143 [Nyssa sinensis]|uniref:CASP-like protein n=1 Tax=Nyssa sinensis TaxID=561372 RepID=A0A5J5BEA3_9ASTE|nr:hypothetical protein F0562_026143 [Nyssa sinensis]
MAPPPSTVVSPVTAVLLRILTFVFLLVSLVILITNTVTLYLSIDSIDEITKLHFKDVYAYRYMVASIVTGIAYTLLQTVFNIFQVSMGKRVGGVGLYQFDCYGDKVMSYILATGASAGFGATIDLKSAFSLGAADKFFNKAIVASTLLLLGFLSTAISSVFSSLALPKRD